MKQSMMFPEARILVLAKAPQRGKVKTRLARTVGHRRAVSLYRQMLDQTLGMLAEARLCPVEIHCAPDTRQGYFRSRATRYGFGLRSQSQGGLGRGGLGRGDLGRRMHRALSQALENSERVVLIGGDCVSLDAAYLRRSLEALQQGRDAVLGPAQDGGYVMIGLNRTKAGPESRLFLGMSWSHARVARQTRRRMQGLGMDWQEMDVRWDLDDARDLQRWLRLN